MTIPDPLTFSLPVLLLLRLSGAQIVYLCHDPLPHAWRMPHWLRWLERLELKLVYSAAARIVVLAPAARETLADEFRIPASRVDILEHGPLPLDATSRLPGTKRFLVFGTLRRNKGILEAIAGTIAARERGCDISLVVAGEPHAEDPSYWRSCQDLAAEAPDCVEIREGFISDDELPALLERVDAFLLPYQNFNSQSGVAILAGTNGRPIVASSSGGIGSLMAQGQPGILIAQPITPETVADALIEFEKTSIGRWTELAEGYRQQLLSTDTWSRVAAGYAQTLYRAAGHSSAMSP